jgi:hypothetical protein
LVSDREIAVGVAFTVAVPGQVRKLMRRTVAKALVCRIHAPRISISTSTLQLLLPLPVKEDLDPPRIGDKMGHAESVIVRMVLAFFLVLRLFN